MRAFAMSLALVTGVLTGCSDGSTEDPSAEPRSEQTTPAGTPSSPPAPPAASPGRVPTPSVAGDVATDLEVPWGIAFLPDDSALVAERDSGLIKRVLASGSVEEVGRVPGVDPGGEGGLLGIAVPQDFASDPWVYAYFTAESDNRIVRMSYTPGQLGEPEVIVDDIPKGSIHNGGRIVFGPDGMLYAGTGERGERGLSQDRDSLGGKILRTTPDGDAPPDNPFEGSVVYSYGHRNVQGLAFDSEGRLWASEFGQDTWDELNLIQPGANYGWPEVEGKAGRNEFVDPLVQWRPDDASPSGIAIADDVVYMAGLRGRRVWQIPIEGDGTGEPRDFFVEDHGRLRSVALAPDGSLWLATSNRDGRGDPRSGDDRILRVTLA